MSRRALTLAVLSGLLLAASFPTLDLPFLCWVGLVPVLSVTRSSSRTHAFWLGGITGLVYFGGTIHWVTSSIHSYGNLPLFPASLITLLLCSYCAVYPALFCAMAAHVRRLHPMLLLVAIPAAWTALELARTHILSGFPWALLGYSQYRLLQVIQIADITGVYGVSFLIVLVNTAVSEFLRDRKRFVPLLVCAVLSGLVAVYGAHRMQTHAGPERIRVSVVQGNIEQDKKWDPAYQEDVIAVYERLTRRALDQKPDLVIWPETATPFYFAGSGENAALTGDLRRFVASARTPLLTGSPTFEVKPNRLISLRNSAFLLNGDGTTGGVYHKLHLVPFGEYVPLRSVLFFVGKMVEAAGDFDRGTEHTVMQVRNREGSVVVPISTVICYEIIFPDLVRRFVDRGARIMTTITNDAWFGRTAAPHQHFTMAVFRAVENRVPFARAANTGISGFIDARGSILETSAIFTEASLTRDIAPSTGKKTFYTRYGDVFAWLCVLTSLVLLMQSPKDRTSWHRIP
jgi:apolipoprotein N-acyltransferase